MQQPETEVPAEAAYVAARDRAMRTTQALIEAEARIVDLTWRLESAEGELRRSRPEPVQEVMHDATDDEADGATAGGAADTAHPFSD